MCRISPTTNIAASEYRARVDAAKARHGLREKVFGSAGVGDITRDGYDFGVGRFSDSARVGDHPIGVCAIRFDQARTNESRCASNDRDFVATEFHCQWAFPMLSNRPARARCRRLDRSSSAGTHHQPTVRWRAGHPISPRPVELVRSSVLPRGSRIPLRVRTFR